ncbi:DUF6471 domain-containing protein [Paraburkholderia sp. 22B1P]|uniref:DUF6471 domain-containing protein n=1 Tax=Paraburkholderia sp. 22B1P TaxID=3080498 RepID=UPI0030927678|nr:DUF6471 domain-containing protein [Paraburkholderia sp. 22B1P]
MSEADTPWAKLATRLIRVALARCDYGYADLIGALTAANIHENERALVNRVSRGTVRLTLLLQILHVAGDVPPSLWTEALKAQGSWEGRAQAIVAAELSRQPWVTPEKLAQRLAEIGAPIGEKTLVSHLNEGTLSLSLFLQCITVLGSPSLDAYLPFNALISAATSTMPAAVQ